MTETEQLSYVILRNYFPKIVIDDNNCWLVSRKVSKNKRQKTRKKQKHILAYSFVASLFLEYNKESKLIICHKCDIPGCINPDHLYIGTQADNMNDRSRLRPENSWNKNKIKSKIKNEIKEQHVDDPNDKDYPELNILNWN